MPAILGDFTITQNQDNFYVITGHGFYQDTDFENNGAKISTEQRALEIAQILTDNLNAPIPPTPEQEIEELKKSQADQDEIIMNLLLGGI